MLIFDLDGLLLDTEKIYHDGWWEVFQRHQIEISREEMLKWGGQSWQQTLAILTELVGSSERVMALRDEREAYVYAQLENGRLQPKPFAKETLALAKEKERTVALATTSVRSKAEELLTTFGMWDYFDFMTFGDEVSAHKPDPEPYLTTLAKAETLASDAVAVEDSIPGATAATRAGLEVILVPDQSLKRQFSDAQKAPLNLFAETTSLEYLYRLLDK